MEMFDEEDGWDHGLVMAGSMLVVIVDVCGVDGVCWVSVMVVPVHL